VADVNADLPLTIESGEKERIQPDCDEIMYEENLASYRQARGGLRGQQYRTGVGVPKNDKGKRGRTSRRTAL